MPAPRIHEMIDFEVFGETYPKVHKWIDGTFNGTNGRTHWINRHHYKAILEHFNSKDYPDKQYREQLIRVARMHVKLDWIFYYKQIILPKTRKDVILNLARNGIFVEK